MKINRQKELTLSYETLINTFNYCTETGIFTYKISRGPKTVGQRAGYLHRTGYRYIEINSIAYAEHRLAWFYCFQEWPENFIDHIDRNPENNSLNNLREADSSINMRNRNIGKNNTSGYLGVSPYNDKWKASFNSKHLGYFNTPEEANLAYIIYKNSL